MGPTASGKTALAERLADALDAQLINADAFQAYRGMDVGTAKPENPARYALMDIKDPNEMYGVGEFTRLASKVLRDLYRKERSAVVVGGTGFYIRALLEEYTEMASAPDPELRARLNRSFEEEGLEALVGELRRVHPEAAERIDLRNPARVKRAIERAYAPEPMRTEQLPGFRKIKFGLMPDAAWLEPRITQRVQQMMQNGWVEEVGRLIASGYSSDDPGFRAIGYREMARYIAGELSLEEAATATIVETRRYAKRQRTWLRAEPNLTVLEGQSDSFATAWERIATMFA